MIYANTHCVLLDSCKIVSGMRELASAHDVAPHPPRKIGTEITFLQNPFQSAQNGRYLALVAEATAHNNDSNFLLCTVSEISPYPASQKNSAWGGDLSSESGGRSLCMITKPGKMLLLSRLDPDFLVLELVDEMFKPYDRSEISLQQVLEKIDNTKFPTCQIKPKAPCSCGSCSWQTLQPLYHKLAKDSQLYTDGMFRKKLIIDWMIKKVDTIFSCARARGCLEIDVAVRFFANHALSSCPVVSGWLKELYKVRNPRDRSVNDQQTVAAQPLPIQASPKKGPLFAYFKQKK